jgi:hypothetical protein
MLYKRMIFSFIIMLLPVFTPAQGFRYGIDFTGILDNREFDNSLEPSQTIFGIRLSPFLSFGMDSNNSINAGIDVMHEFGSKKPFAYIMPIGFYRFLKTPHEFYIGMFNRKKIIDYPRILLSDSAWYYRPNIEGGFYGFAWRWGSQNIWIDWTGRQTANIRESFLVGSSGKIAGKNYFLANYFLYFHNANRGIRLPGDLVQDNVGFVLQNGVRVFSIGFIDSITAGISGVASAFQNRGDNTGYHSHIGAIAEIAMLMKWAGVQLLFYNGEGHELTWGDAFYRARTYTRADCFLLPINSQYVKARFEIALHIIDSQLDHSEVFRLDASFGQKVGKKQGM